MTIRYAVAYTGHLDLLRLDRGTKYDEKTEQDIKDEEAGKLVFSYGTEDVEVKTMRQVTWEEGNLVFDIIAGDDTVDMDTLVDMAEDMIRA